MARFIRENRCRTVGMVARENSWEYPLWVLTRAGGEDTVRFFHYAVRNVSGSLPPEGLPGSGACLCNMDSGNCRIFGPSGE